MKPSTVLKKARKLIERGWCRGPLAENKAGASVNPRSRYACSWCAMGAIIRASNDGPVFDSAMNFADRAAKPRYGIISLNEDATDKRPVLRAFDRAIKLAISEGQ